MGTVFGRELKMILIWVSGISPKLMVSVFIYSLTEINMKVAGIIA